MTVPAPEPCGQRMIFPTSDEIPGEVVMTTRQHCKLVHGCFGFHPDFTYDPSADDGSRPEDWPQDGSLTFTGVDEEERTLINAWVCPHDAPETTRVDGPAPGNPLADQTVGPTPLTEERFAEALLPVTYTVTVPYGGGESPAVTALRVCHVALAPLAQKERVGVIRYLMDETTAMSEEPTT